jgi:glycosyltransferase involved in cell wall biosynthesis
MSTMRLSVVVPTYRRCDALQRALAALAGQLRQADEILVVARPDDDEAGAAIEAASYGLPIERVDVLQPGLVAALNAGLDAARGDVVAFTDDDAEPHPDWLQRIEQTFESDSRIAGAGGRDWVFYGAKLVPGAERVVGRVSWYGRVTGNHHAGIGGLRDVYVLKGVNMAFRRSVIASIRFDERLRGVGTEHHSELGACLRIRAAGWRVVYDPGTAVDHRPAPRIEGKRELGDEVVTRSAAHNETLAVLEYLPRWRHPVYLAWALLVGTVVMPGPVQLARAMATVRRPDVPAGRAALAGRLDGWDTYRASRRRTTLAIGHSVYAAERARQLLAGRQNTIVIAAGPGWTGILRACGAVLRHRPEVVYLVDVGMSTTLAAAIARILRRPIVLDTGDRAYELARSLGGRSAAGMAAVRIGEKLTLRVADHVVVRGRGHLEHLASTPGSVVPDLPPDAAKPKSGARVRKRLGLGEGVFVVGLVGSLNWSPRLERCYGWDLVEALVDAPEYVHALIVGDGDGLRWLEDRAAALGVADRCHFVGRVASDSVAEWIGAMDAAISTQTNDAVGEVRTTGKLPLYLACGCPVIASDVGEAARLLGPLGWTVPYTGTIDPQYPARLGERIVEWAEDSTSALERQDTAIRLAATAFPVAALRERLAAILDEVQR